jgi:hypothetical protein
MYYSAVYGIMFTYKTIVISVSFVMGVDRYKHGDAMSFMASWWIAKGVTELRVKPRNIWSCIASLWTAKCVTKW